MLAHMEAAHEKEMICTKRVLEKVLDALAERGVRIEISTTTNQASIVSEKPSDAPVITDKVQTFPELNYNTREHNNGSWCFIHKWKMSRREASIQGPIDDPMLTLTRTIEFFKYHVHYKRKTLFVPLTYAHDHRTGEMVIIYLDMAGNLLYRNAIEWVRFVKDEESNYIGRPYINTGHFAVAPSLQEAFYGSMAAILATAKPKSEIITDTLVSVGLATEKKDA